MRVFLDTATLRENIVALARNVGYVPRSRKAVYQAIISFNITGLPETYRTVTLDSGLVCIGSGVDGNFKFSIPEQITVPVRSGTASFSNITVYEGTFLSQSWIVDTNEPDIKYDLPNSFCRYINYKSKCKKYCIRFCQSRLYSC